MNRLVIAYMLVAAIALVGCRMAEEPTPTPEPVEQIALTAQRVDLIGTSWEAEFFGESDQPLPVLPDSKLTLSIMADKYAGYSGCDWFSGVYDVSGDELRFYSPAQTAFMCENEAIEAQSATYLSGLVTITRYEIDGDKLVTYSVGDQKMLTFSPTDRAPVEGVSWTAKIIVNGEEMQQASSWDMTVSARFEDGKLTGFGGCNDYTADYLIDDNTIAITNLEHAGVTCDEPPGASDIETMYFAALDATTYYEALAASLLFTDDENRDLILFGTP